MNYDLSNIPQLFKTYPNLAIVYKESLEMAGDRPEIIDIIEPQQLMAFIVLSYHVKSPLAKEPSIHTRRQLALAEVGYPVKTAEDIKSNPELAKLIVGRNDFVNRLALHFCKFENSIDWLELCSLQDIMDDVTLTLKQESEGTDKKSAQEILKLKLDIREKATKTRTEMHSLATSIFSNDMHLLDYAASHMILQKRIKIISPENFCKALKDADGDLSKVFPKQPV